MGSKVLRSSEVSRDRTVRFGASLNRRRLAGQFSCERVEQSPSVLQIVGVQALCEPEVDRREQVARVLRNLVNFLRTLALPERVEHWSLTTLREKLVKIGAQIVRHGRYVVFQLAEVAVPRALFAEILRRIECLRPRPPPFSA